MNKILFYFVLLFLFACSYVGSGAQDKLSVTTDLYSTSKGGIYVKTTIQNNSEYDFYLEKKNICLNRKDFRRNILSIGSVGADEKVFGYSGFIDDSFDGNRHSDEYINLSAKKKLIMYFNLNKFYDLGDYNGQVVYRFHSYNNNIDYTEQALQSELKFISLSDLPIIDMPINSNCETFIY